MVFEVFKDKAGDYRWRLKARNGEIVADSGEGNAAKSDCLHGIQVVKSGAAAARTMDAA